MGKEKGAVRRGRGIGGASSRVRGFCVVGRGD